MIIVPLVFACARWNDMLECDYNIETMDWYYSMHVCRILIEPEHSANMYFREVVAIKNYFIRLNLKNLSLEILFLKILIKYIS